jgi:CBS domain-containing protein
MREARHFLKEVQTANRRASVKELAEQMRYEGLGALVVVDGERRPLGIVTDRDLTLRVVAAGRRAKETSAENVMSQPLVTIEPTDSIEAVIERMRSNGIRRVPVIQDQRVVGLVSLDDLVVQLGSEIDALGTAVRNQYRDVRRGAVVESILADLRDRLAPLSDQIERAGDKAREVLLRELDALRDRLRQD